MSRIVVPKDCVSSYMEGYLKISTAEQIVLNEKVKTKMASRSSLSSSQPRLHGACLLPGHILVNERFHGSAVVKALQESHVTVQIDDNMGVLDFHPSTDVGVVYLTEADLVEGDTYKSKLNKLTKASFRKVVLAEKTPLSSQYFLSLQKFVVIERGLVLLPVANSDEVGKILAQMVFLESKPQNNPYRIKMKPTPIDKTLLTTLQAVPGLGQKKALSLLTQYGISIKCGWKSKCPTSEGFFPASNSWRQEEEHTVLSR
ncbi:Fanconi anemia core complex-associated protein 24-like isoform X4 [Acropora palmata]|uniref:Fanconi anemia core complex-associated protein 24-like isoform X4 n=1 Tax=Acropora palmata TaxID=6131 RepID=UPI003D9FFBB1